MGTFKVWLEIANQEIGEFVPVEAMVDTESPYPLMPADLLRDLNVRPVSRITFELSDGQQVELDDGEVKMRIEGREWTVPVVFAPEGTIPRLGRVALVIFGLAADPVNRRLISTPPHSRPTVLGVSID